MSHVFALWNHYTTEYEYWNLGWAQRKFSRWQNWHVGFSFTLLSVWTRLMFAKIYLTTFCMKPKYANTFFSHPLTDSLLSGSDLCYRCHLCFFSLNACLYLIFTLSSYNFQSFQFNKTIATSDYFRGYYCQYNNFPFSIYRWFQFLIFHLKITMIRPSLLFELKTVWPD